MDVEKIKAFVQDRPTLLTLLFTLLVGLHCFLTGRGLAPNLWDSLIGDTTNIITLAVGLASGGAILAGFAGVIVIHGLSASSPRFREYRLKAGKSLHANWASISSAGFIAAGVSMVAAVVAFTPFIWWSPWLMEFAAILSIHGVVRLLWLLRTLFKLQADDDKDQYSAANKAPLDKIFGDG